MRESSEVLQKQNSLGSLPLSASRSCPRRYSKCFVFSILLLCLQWPPPMKLNIMPAIKEEMFRYHKHDNEEWICSREAIDWKWYNVTNPQLYYMQVNLSNLIIQLKGQDFQTITTRCCLHETHLRNQDMEDIKTKVYVSITRNKEGCFIMVKSWIHKKLKQIKNCMHVIT